MDDPNVANRSRHRRDRGDQIPVSLGKGSLRIRLEAYYSLISPDNLTNRTEWLQKYDQIYEKYGGSHEGERKLATKLSKKYGTTVQLLLAESVEAVASSNSRRRDGNNQNISGPDQQQDDCHNEAWYELRPNETNSQDLNFLSNNFDPIAALTCCEQMEDLVYQSNPWMTNEQPLPDTMGYNDDGEGQAGIPSYQPAPLILDNIEKFTIYLPRDDPLRRETPQHMRKRSIMMTATATASANNNSKRHKAKHPFDSIAQSFDTAGPHSVLYKLQRERVQVVIRYVNAIRGTLTGTLIAFDKHMNMILRDVEEVYSPRPFDEDNSRSNLELELDRRRAIEMETLRDSAAGYLDKADRKMESVKARGWAMRKRSMRQIMVRGDMVVAVYDASKERKVNHSRYFNKGTGRRDGTINANVNSTTEMGAQGEPT